MDKVKVINILLVEDDTLDVMDAKRTLDRMDILYKMHVAKNGEEALAHLKDISYNGGDKPDIMLLDLNMPKMNGIELLTIIRQIFLNVNFQSWSHHEILNGILQQKV